MLKYLKRKRKNGEEDDKNLTKKRKIEKKRNFEPQKEYKFITWNVNGLKARYLMDSQKPDKSKADYLKKIISREDPDFLCMQETKLANTEDNTDTYKYAFKDYVGYFSHCKKRKGYSGVAIFVNVNRKKKNRILSVDRILGDSEIDNEGRFICLEMKKFFLVNVYVPNSGHELARLDYRAKWDNKIWKRIEELKKKKHVILCGDLNVVSDIKKDLWMTDIKEIKKLPCCTDQERNSFNNFLKDKNCIDCYNYLYPKDRKTHYTHFSYHGREYRRELNRGWRIDYFVVGKKLQNHLKEMYVLNEDQNGSDHNPLTLILSKSKLKKAQ